MITHIAPNSGAPRARREVFAHPLELLGKARGDVSEEEDSPSSTVHRLRIRSLKHIANADRMVREGIEDARALHEPPPRTVVVAPPPPPPPPSRHPAYPHALTDLRAPRAFLEPPANVVVEWDEKRAIRAIDDAIRQIKEAAIDDGKDISDHEPVDRPTWGGRLQRALELLGKAHATSPRKRTARRARSTSSAAARSSTSATPRRFVKEGHEDPRAARGAAAAWRQARCSPGVPPRAHRSAHGARAARAADPRRRGQAGREPRDRPDRRGAREIHEAAIDDGKPMNDHPPIDARLHHRDRIRGALDLLEKSAKDIEEREDNTFARACGAARSATSATPIRFTREAVEYRRR
jgi:hypothetical protein